MAKEKKRRANRAKNQRRVADLEALHQVGLDLASIRDPDELVQHAVDIVREAFGYYHVAFLAYDAADNVLWPAAYSGEQPAPPRHMRFPLDQGITGLVAQQRESIIVNDTGTDPRYPEGGIPGVGSEAAFPIQRGEQLFGVLSVTSQEPGVFDEETVRTLTTLANQVAVVLENAQYSRRFDEERRRREEATTLRDVGAAITASLDLPTILRAIYEATAPALNADTFYVALYDEVQQLLSFEFVVDAGAMMEPFTHQLDQAKGITAWVIRHRQPLLLRDIMKESPIEPLQMGAMPQSSVMVPIMSQDRLIGVIAAQSQEPNAFDERHQWLLSAVADQAAIAIENARLYQQARAVEQGLGQQVNVLTTLLSVAHALQAPGDLQPKLDLVARGVVDAGLWGRAVISVFDDEWRAVSIGTAGLTPEEVTTLRQAPHRSREERMQFYDEQFRISASYYIPHDADVSAGCVESQCRVEEFVDWHPDDRLLVPLYGEGGRIIGQLSVDDPADGRRPTAESLKPLELFANQAAVVVENARLFAELQLMNKDLEGVLESQLELLKAVQELSSPVVPIFEGVLVMPLVGAIDFSRAQQITYDLLAAIEAERARFAIIDITGVPMIDSHVARYLADAMQAARLVGTVPVLVGITPGVAQTMVEIRADLGDVTTRSDLQSGVAYALRQLSREGRQRNPGPSSLSERKT